MPQYKKKNVKKHKRSIKNAVSDDIVMRNSTNNNSTLKNSTNKNYVKNKRINIIRGNKAAIRNRRFTIICICGILALLIFLVSVLTPTGLFETLTNFSATLKFGNSFPIKLSGGTLTDTVSQGNHAFLVSTTNFECYHTSGKNIFSYQHGYKLPMIDVSESRTLLYDQSGKNFSVYNLNKRLFEGTTDNEILNTAIARNGYYAIATLSNSYSSQVTVYNTDNEKIYEWFCSDHIINNILLSPNGKTLVVSAFTASNGTFVSKLYILEFDSATPTSTYDYSDLILSLNKSGTRGFTCVLQNNVDFFTWRKFKVSNFEISEEILFSENYNSDTLIVTGRQANKQVNGVNIFDHSGKLKNSFTFNGIIDAIELKDSNVYILSENNIYLYSVEGKFMGTSFCEFGSRFVLPISQKEAAAVTDNNIQKINF